MRDLELRGAGNLLGDEQSGHVAALGFELYMQMLDEALRRRARRAASRGEREWEPVRLDVDVDAYVPADYVGYEQAKIDLHRRIAGAREVADIEELRDELDGPLRPAARAGRAPAGAPARADQARRRRRARGQLPRRASRDHADRARLGGPARAARAAAGGGL